MREEAMDLLWSAEDYLGLLDHSELEVRTWAAERLVAQHPLRSLEPLLARVELLEWAHLSRLAPALLDAGPEAWGEALVNAALRAPPWAAADLLEPLVRSRHPQVEEALAGVLPRLESLEYWPLRNSLMQLSASESTLAAEYLRGLACSSRPIAPAAREALAGMGRAEELEALAAEFGPEAALHAFCAAVGADVWLSAVAEERAVFGGAAVERLAREYGIALRLSEPTRELLRRSSEVRAWLAPLQAEIRAWIAEDGGDLAQWRAAEPLEGWRWLAVGFLVVLQALQRHAEGGKFVTDEASDRVLSLLLDLGSGRDEEALLAREEDRAERVLAALFTPQRQLSERVEGRAADLGIAALPALEAALRDEGNYWGAVRAARTVGRLALRDPDGCLSAVPALIAALKRDRGDDLFEAANAALGRIGPTKLPILLERLADPEDEHDYIWAYELSEIPAAESLRALLSNLEGVVRQEGLRSPMLNDEVDVLGDLGLPQAIPFLRSVLQRSSLKIGFQPLLTLLLLHAPDDPLIPLCRRLVAAQEKRSEKLRIEWGRASAGPRQARRDKLSRQERKKRAANRKQSRRKKGGKKR